MADESPPRRSGRDRKPTLKQREIDEDKRIAAEKKEENRKKAEERRAATEARAAEAQADAEAHGTADTQATAEASRSGPSPPFIFAGQSTPSESIKQYPKIEGPVFIVGKPPGPWPPGTKPEGYKFMWVGDKNIPIAMKDGPLYSRKDALKVFPPVYGQRSESRPGPSTEGNPTPGSAGVEDRDSRLFDFGSVKPQPSSPTDAMRGETPGQTSGRSSSVTVKGESSAGLKDKSPALASRRFESVTDTDQNEEEDDGANVKDEDDEYEYEYEGKRDEDF